MGKHRQFTLAEVTQMINSEFGKTELSIEYQENTLIHNVGTKINNESRTPSYSLSGCDALRKKDDEPDYGYGIERQ